jgi:hypothetical protein
MNDFEKLLRALLAIDQVLSDVTQCSYTPARSRLVDCLEATRCDLLADIATVATDHKAAE